MTQTWFITGCSTGFGKILAEELLNGGYNVVATARKVETLDALKTITAGKLLALPLDVTDKAAIDKAVDAAIKQFGQIDVLVNNAGYGMLGAVEEVEMDAVRKMFDTNLFGLMEVTRAVLPHMRKRRAGHIINLSSAAGVVPTGGFSSYNATKFAVEGLSQALALEVAHLGIGVTLIEPGPFRTDFAGRSIDVTSEAIDDYADSVGKTRQFLSAIDGTQAGDPLKAAQIMIQIGGQKNPPLHLPLGNSAFDRISAKVATWQALLKECESLSRSADYEETKAA